ncbi:MAG: Crp/Fnr family transcriptional regulator [Deltaproteobacteria bacterium]|nr:Crp/Fnr family transcriptional regulator [Deltaproteobacteria bacterium]
MIQKAFAQSDKVYLVQSGRVRLLRQGKGRRKSLLAVLKPGDLFGDVLRSGSALDEQAESSGKSEVWSIEGRDFRALLEARPALAVDVIRALGERVQEMRRRVVGLTRKDVPARLADSILALAGDHGEKAEGERHTSLTGVTQQDLADLVGASRSFVSTLVNQMKRDGLLTSQGRRLIITDTAGLQKLASVEK